MSGFRILPAALVVVVLWGTANLASAEPPAGRPTDAGKTPAELAALANGLEQAYAGKDQPEAVRMLIAIARGSQMGPGEGWFGPAQTRYTWDWLVQLHGPESAGGSSGTNFTATTRRLLAWTATRTAASPLTISTGPTTTHTSSSRT